MASKEDVDLLGMIISETVLRLIGFGPSKQICDEFARSVLAEASLCRARVDVRNGKTEWP